MCTHGQDAVSPRARLQPRRKACALARYPLCHTQAPLAQRGLYRCPRHTRTRPRHVQSQRRSFHRPGYRLRVSPPAPRRPIREARDWAWLRGSGARRAAWRRGRKRGRAQRLGESQQQRSKVIEHSEQGATACRLRCGHAAAWHVTRAHGAHGAHGERRGVVGRTAHRETTRGGSVGAHMHLHLTNVVGTGWGNVAWITRPRFAFRSPFCGLPRAIAGAVARHCCTPLPAYTRVYALGISGRFVPRHARFVFFPTARSTET